MVEEKKTAAEEEAAKQKAANEEVTTEETTTEEESSSWKPADGQNGNQEEQESVEELQQVVEDLKSQLQALEKELEEAQNQYLRLSADFDNYRRRTKKEREQLLETASEELLKKLLPVLDNLDLALANARQAEESNTESLRTGVEMVARQFKQALASEGLEPVPGEGEPFDPRYHEAVAQVDGDPEQSGLVVEVLRPGYRLKDKILRASMVKVGK